MLQEQHGGDQGHVAKAEGEGKKVHVKEGEVQEEYLEMTQKKKKKRKRNRRCKGVRPATTHHGGSV